VVLGTTERLWEASQNPLIGFIRVSVQVIKKLLKTHFFKRRKAPKKETLKQVAGRDEQFIRIAELKALYRTTGNLIISMDTKKKELLGNFYRDGNPASQKMLSAIALRRA
jgi:Rhodopirellula transposase DDE domain